MNKDGVVALSDAAWAWEGLRRNPDYRKAWARHQSDLPDTYDGHDLMRYLRLDKPYLEAETYGLLAFADPDLPASESPVLWLPELLAGSLFVRLGRQSGEAANTFSIASLKCNPTVLDTSDGRRHIRFGGHDLWIQLVTEDRVLLDGDTPVTLLLDGRPGMSKRLRAAAKLLAIHRPDCGKVLRPRPKSNREKLHEGLLAWDIYSGLDCQQGSLKDIAIALFGEARVAADWTSNPSMKNAAARARDRGRVFVEHGYRSLLRRATF